MIETILLAALLLLSLALLVRVLRGKRYAYGWTARFIASPQFSADTGVAARALRRAARE